MPMIVIFIFLEKSRCDSEMILWDINDNLENLASVMKFFTLRKIRYHVYSETHLAHWSGTV